MEELIVHLELIRITAKQIHYSEKGDCFYSNHLLMDRIAKDMYDFEDSIIESIIMAETGEPPVMSDIYSTIASKTDLLSLIKQTIYLVEEKAKKDRFQGDYDLLGRISNNLRQSFALLSRVLIKGDKVSE